MARDAVAYAHYLEGRKQYAEEDVTSAIESLEKAVKLDPDYALAWSYLGSAYLMRASSHSGGETDYKRAQAALQKSINLIPTQSRSYIVLASLLTETGQVEKAIPQLKKVLDNDPQNALAQWEMSYAYRYAGLLNESLKETRPRGADDAPLGRQRRRVARLSDAAGVESARAALLPAPQRNERLPQRGGASLFWRGSGLWGERALDNDRTFSLLQTVFVTRFYKGQYQEFLASLAKAKDVAYVNFYRGFAYYHLKDYVRARAAFDRAYELNPNQ
ncbi:MAG: tetratricopeptide repeat protein, partial [Acidobacteriota bacterium]|nr:tetratricopeptide repeat protein [Acidobacteriota bacterium]